MHLIVSVPEFTYLLYLTVDYEMFGELWVLKLLIDDKKVNSRILKKKKKKKKISHLYLKLIIYNIVKYLFHFTVFGIRTLYFRPQTKREIATINFYSIILQADTALLVIVTCKCKLM